MPSLPSRTPARAHLATATTALLLAATALAGTLEPPGPPAPTMKTLFECEPRTALLGPGPFVIRTSGSYYLTQDVDASASHGLVIEASDVTLDLNGFTVLGVRAVGADGLHVGPGVTRVTVRNGRIAEISRGAYINSCNDVHLDSILITGREFQGIIVLGSEVDVTRCRIEGSLYKGVEIGPGSDVRIHDCTLIGGSPGVIDGIGDLHVDVRRCTIIGGAFGIQLIEDPFSSGGPRGVVMDNVVTASTNVGINVACTNVGCPGLVVARNLSTGSPTNYSLVGATAAPVASLTTSPSAWANVE